MSKAKKQKSGRTIAQLEAENDRLRARIEKLAVGDTLRFEGEEWFEIEEYFNAEKIERVPAMGGMERAYMMGFVEDVLVIEVPKDTPDVDIHAFNAHLKDMGLSVPFVTVTAGVRFLKLRRVPEEVALELDKAELKTFESAVEERQTAIQQALEKKAANAEATSTKPGHCPECNEPGYTAEQGCVYCGHNRRGSRKVQPPGDAGAGPEPASDGVGGARPGDDGDPGDRDDSHGEGEAEGTSPLG